MTYMICELLLRLVLVAALIALMNDACEMLERVLSELASSKEFLITLIASIGDSSVDRLMDSFIVSLQVLLVALRFSAQQTHERLEQRLLGMTIYQVTLQAFLQHDHIARRTLHVDFDLRVHRLSMVLHVAAALESFVAIFDCANEFLRRLMNSLDVILQVVGRICGERAMRTLLVL